MTPKINLTIQVDAPTPEQFERYLAANGWRRVNPHLESTHWRQWMHNGVGVSVPLMVDTKDYPWAAWRLVCMLAHLTDKPELEVYNEIVAKSKSPRVSEEERQRRLPPPPYELIDARHDPIVPNGGRFVESFPISRSKKPQ